MTVNEKPALRSPPRVVTLAHRLFFPAEIEALLHYAGFKILVHAGGFAEDADSGLSQDLDGAPLTIVSAEQVICARAR